LLVVLVVIRPGKNDSSSTLHNCFKYSEFAKEAENPTRLSESRDFTGVTRSAFEDFVPNYDEVAVHGASIEAELWASQDENKENKKE